jgi:transitional endoplasmic reticulum ATPase
MHRRLANVFYEVRRPLLAWDDIGGLADVKTLLREMVCLPFSRRAALGRMGVTPPSGVMLWGPLGNGITMLAEACASEVGATFFHVSGREMLGRPGDLADAFHLAIEETPCVLYVTDVDWLAPRAGADYRWNDGTERGKPPTFADPSLTRVFVELLDEVEGHADVALLGSCYRIDVVDQAVLRDKDRFNRKVYVHPPTEVDRLKMLRLFTSRLPSEEGLPLEEWAARTVGFVGWDVENFCRKAALAAVAAGRERISPADLESAFPQIRPWLTPAMAEGYPRLYEGDCPHHYAF